MNIYVGNLSETADEAGLRRTFEDFGHVARVSIVRDARTGTSRGYGYIEMPDVGEARRAIRGVHRSEFRGAPLAVGPAPFQGPLAELVETQADFGDFAR